MRLKAKFRPNLADAGNRARLRRISGCDSANAGGINAPSRRNRTVSGSSNSGKEHRLLSSPPPVSPTVTAAAAFDHHPPVATRVAAHVPPAVHRVVESPLDLPAALQVSNKAPSRLPSLSSPENVDPLGGGNVSGIPKPRHEPHTREGREVLPQPASVFDRRKADHKKKFTGGVPERTKMTMFDLIYYNNPNGSRMSNSSSSRRNSRASASSDEHGRAALLAAVPEEEMTERMEEEAVDDLVDEKLPVPQVKVGPNGEIVLDEESTLIETTAAKKAKEDLLRSPLVFENGNQCTNYGTWGKKKKSQDWSGRETVRFYKALSVFGTDFSMMESIFKKRTRQELKLKFKKEERQNRDLVDRCLREGMQFDTSIFKSDSEDEEETDPAAKKRRREVEKKKKKKKRVRKTKSNRGYYSSSDADESEAANSESSDSKRNSVENKRDEGGDAASSLLKTLLTKDTPPPSQSPTTPGFLSSPSMAFPPGLLAANPDLAKAVPGSLVVVASPAENDPARQMLHIYRVTASEQDKNSPPSEEEVEDGAS